jgi:alpha-ketoglutarate-dependent taurine dioxygenase
VSVTAGDVGTVPKLLRRLGQSGWLEIELGYEPSDWRAVVERLVELTGRAPVGFDGTSECAGVNFIGIGSSTFRSSSISEIPLHQEGYDLEEPPELLAFYYAAECPEEPTWVVDAARALMDLSPGERERLAQMQIRFRREERCRDWTPWRKLLHVSRANLPGLRFAEPEPGFRKVEVRGGPETLFQELRGVLLRNRLEFTWNRGVVLLIDNMRCLHGRPALRSESRRRLLRVVFPQVGEGAYE